jgi:dihydroneopterin aldolase
MPDQIIIRELATAAKVGVPEGERAIPQPLELEVTLTGDFRELDDDLARTTDYAAVTAWLRAECGRSRFRLIESLADHLAEGLLGNFPAAASATVEIRKRILPGTRHVAVRVERERAGKNP